MTGNTNTSGMGEYSELPEELKGWNWGAFWLTWIWGISHRVWISLLCFVPLVGLVMPFYLGAAGSGHAWKANIWTDEEEFLRDRKKWSAGGFCYFGVLALATVLMVLYEGGQARERQEQMAAVTARLESSELVAARVGGEYTLAGAPFAVIEANGGERWVSAEVIVERARDGKTFWVSFSTDADGRITEARAEPFEEDAGPDRADP